MKADIRKIRQDAELSQYQVGEVLGVSQSVVSRAERGYGDRGGSIDRCAEKIAQLGVAGLKQAWQNRQVKPPVASSASTPIDPDDWSLDSLGLSDKGMEAVRKLGRDSVGGLQTVTEDEAVRAGLTGADKAIVEWAMKKSGLEWYPEKELEYKPFEYAFVPHDENITKYIRVDKLTEHVFTPKPNGTLITYKTRN